MENLAKLIEGISSLLWPLFAMVIIIILNKPIKEVIKSWTWRKSTFKIGDVEISVDEYNNQQRDIIGDIQDKVISLEKQIKDFTNINEKAPKDKSIKINSILWVDDYPINHIQIVEQIKNKGFVVTQVKSTSEALGELIEHDYDLIITDMHRKEDGIIHENAGLELLKAVKSKDEAIPVIFYFGRSKKSAERFKKLVFSAGANMITSSPTELMYAIENPDFLKK